MTQYQTKRATILVLSLFFSCQATTSNCMLKQLFVKKLFKEQQKNLAQNDNPVFSIDLKKELKTDTRITVDPKTLMTTIYYLKDNVHIVKTYNKKGRMLTQIIQFPNEKVPMIFVETPIQKE